MAHLKPCPHTGGQVKNMQKAKVENKVVKKVRIGQDEYIVSIGPSVLMALGRWGAGYSDEVQDKYIVNLNHSKSWASITHEKVYVQGLMQFLINVDYVRKGEARKFIENVKKRLEQAEDNTPEVKEVFDAVISWMKEHFTVPDRW